MSEIENITYQDRTYVQLSEEFRQLFPTAIHAFQLIPYMYKRLTSVDGLSHKDAVTKIKEDHKDLSGFSYRNISRSLPKDSSIVPRRVVPSRHKSSITELNQPIKLSNTKSSDSDEHSEGKPTVNEISSTQSSDCKNHIQKIHQLENTNRELEQALKASSILMTGETYVPVKHWQREFELSIPFRELKIQLIRQSNISGQGEPVIIYGILDLTSNKVSYTLGKKPEQN